MNFRRKQRNENAKPLKVQTPPSEPTTQPAGVIKRINHTHHTPSIDIYMYRHYPITHSEYKRRDIRARQISNACQAIRQLQLVSMAKKQLQVREPMTMTMKQALPIQTPAVIFG